MMFNIILYIYLNTGSKLIIEIVYTCFKCIKFDKKQSLPVLGMADDDLLDTLFLEVSVSVYIHYTSIGTPYKFMITTSASAHYTTLH